MRGVPGVGWTMPLFKGLLPVKLADGRRAECEVVGMDDATVNGGPLGRASSACLSFATTSSGR